MTAVTLQHPLEQPAPALVREEPPSLELSEALGDDNHSRKKHKKKNKEERRKRSRSCSTDASCCSTSSKRKKKKKKHHRRSLDEPPSPKVNPIFLWVKEDNAKIVEVRCEDYDRRNRIKLTKTAGGWRAIPHVEIMEWQSAPINAPKTETEDSPAKLEPISLDSSDSSCHEVVNFKTEPMKSPDVPVRGETPPPKLEICKTESDEPFSEMESREMPPLEPQTDVCSPRPCKAVVEPKISTVDEGEADEEKDSSSIPAPLDDHQSEPIIPEDSNIEPPKTATVSEKSLSDESTSEEEKPECSVKCCDEVPSNNVDENHNNEFDSDPRSSCMIEPSNFCQDVEAILGAIENSEQRVENTEVHSASENGVKDVEEYDHSALMSELEEMMNERMKHENAAHKDVLEDIYTFVPSPTQSHEKPKPKEVRPTSKIERVIEAVKAKTAGAMMAKVSSAGGEERPKDPPPSQLKTCELESLDLLWRLPEGTTIHHSKMNDEKEPEQVHVQLQDVPESTTATISLVKPTTPIVTSPASVPNLIPSQPVQEEPLNLGKPRRTTPPAPAAIPPAVMPQMLKKEMPVTCKVETKPLSHLHLMDSDNQPKSASRMTERFTPEPSKSTEPLAQLKEIMSDPDLTVPDPLLVPKERLSALIANPKREIPRLMALTNEVKYPKLDTNVMEVSLAHLQLLLQSSKKEDELKLIQKHADLLQSHLKNDAAALDPAMMNALNQMMWFPYISHLDMSRGGNPQDLMGMMNMMYPYGGWGQQSYDYAQQSHLMNFWQNMAHKPNLGHEGGHKGYNDLYKPPIPHGIPQSLYTSAPSVGSQVHHTQSYSSRSAKHARRHHHRSGSSGPQGAPDFHKTTPDFLKTTPDFLKTTPDFLKTTPDFIKTAPDFLKSAPNFLKNSPEVLKNTPDYLKTTPDFFKPPFDIAWALPQTSEAGRTTRAPSRPEPSTLPPSSTAKTPVPSTEPSPKLKVRKFDVDPNAVPKLINKNLTAPPLPPLAAMARQVPSNYYDSNHLWNPLYGAAEAREPDYTSTGHWNWTTPVTVSGK